MSNADLREALRWLALDAGHRAEKALQRSLTEHDSSLLFTVGLYTKHLATIEKALAQEELPPVCEPGPLPEDTKELLADFLVWYECNEQDVALRYANRFDLARQGLLED